MSKIIKVNSREELQKIFKYVEVAAIMGLTEELEALINISSSYEVIVTPERTYYKLHFSIHDKEFYILAHSLGKPGIPLMAITLMEILHSFPMLKYIGLIGIAAGSNSQQQHMGDLLIPTNVYNYEMGKYSEGVANKEIIFKSNYSAFSIDEDILQKISAVTRDNEILAGIRRNWKEPKTDKLKVHTDNFACGSSVIASSKKVKEIEAAIARKYIGLDMESYALATVNQLKYNPYPKLFIIKAISDFADTNKDDSEHKYACYTSATMFIEVCSKVLINFPLNSQELEATVHINDNHLEANIAIYKTATKEYDEIDIQDVNERVEKKDIIASKLGELILEKKIPKPVLTNLYSEGSMVGLVMSIYLDPQTHDKDLIFAVYDRVRHPFTKHKILDAIELMLNRQLFDKDDYKKIRQIFELFSFNADTQLTAKIKRVENVLNRFEFIKMYSVPNGNLLLNTTLVIDSGNPRFQEVDDPIFERVLAFEGDYSTESIDILTDSYGRVVSVIEFTYINFKQFVVYVKVRCRKAGEKDNIERWVSFRNEVFDISKVPGQEEKAFPVEAKDLYHNWKKVNVDMPDCVRQLFGEEGIEYVNLLKMRVRGSGKLAIITIR